MIQGTKQNPFKVPGGAVQVDGLALEFNITPAATKKEFVGNIKQVYAHLQHMVPGYNLAIEPTAVFEKGYFDSLPDEAKELGCEPDFNGWKRSINPRPEVSEPFRTAGGHIHIGWRGPGTDNDLADISDPNHFDDCCAIAQQLDYFLGIWSLLLDKDSKRRVLYGKAGCFRPKEYGVEYRTLSNFWIKNEDVMGWAYDQTVLAMKKAEEGDLYSKKHGGVAQQIIDGNVYDWKKHVHFTDECGVPPPGGTWGAE
jgi:hypothetical protein